ncbi:MAG: hypothetical protein EB054_02720, partial [Actinobacteria bacterium]|nr:hypothetical protein [Actinomycetota bacterium]
ATVMKFKKLNDKICAAEVVPRSVEKTQRIVDQRPPSLYLDQPERENGEVALSDVTRSSHSASVPPNVFHDIR